MLVGVVLPFLKFQKENDMKIELNLDKDGDAVMIYNDYKVITIKEDYEPDSYEVYKGGEFVDVAYSLTDVFGMLNS